MEEQNGKLKKEELQSLKEEIQKILNIYNNSADEKLCLSTENNESIAKKDVSKYLVCSYGNLAYWGAVKKDKIGIFVYSRESYIYRKNFLNDFGGSYSKEYIGEHQIYTGVDSPNVAIYECSQHGGQMLPGYTFERENGSYLSATCCLGESFSFEDLRAQMYHSGEIGPYEIGKATDEEIIKVLNYARGVIFPKYDNKHQKHSLFKRLKCRDL